MALNESEVRERYRELLILWRDRESDSRKANAVLRKHHAYYKQIRDTPEGQRAIRSLLSDPEPAVRCVAATHSLPFAPDEAVPVLEEILDLPILLAVDAKYTLQQYRDGTLNLDW